MRVLVVLLAVFIVAPFTGALIGVTASRALGVDEVPVVRQHDAAKAAPALVHQTSFVVFPQDCNANNMLFGGKTLAEMDRTAAVTTRRLLYSSPVGARDAVTVAIDGVRFHKAAQVKDLVYVTGTVTEVGKKSVTVKVAVERETATAKELLAEGEFTFVAYDAETRKAIEHGVTK